MKKKFELAFRLLFINCFYSRGSNLSRNNIGVSQLNTSKNEFHFLQQYCNTKLCTILFALELNRRFNKMNVENAICKACHPGNFLSTNLFRKWSVFCCLNFCLSRFSKKIVSPSRFQIVKSSLNIFFSFCSQMQPRFQFIWQPKK